MVGTFVRGAAAPDAGRCAELLTELGYPSSGEALVRRMKALLARPDYRVAVATREEMVVGLGAVHVFPAIHSDQPLAFIAALVVGAAHRGAGVGARLVAELEAFAASHGCDRILVTTATRRDGAHRFYERLGYDFTGRRYAKRLG